MLRSEVRGSSTGLGSDGLTKDARAYALKELARRAGVSPEFYRSWAVEFHQGETIVRLEPGSPKSIRFRNAPDSFWCDLALGRVRTARAAWIQPPEKRIRDMIPDFVVPFASDEYGAPRPLFCQADRDTATCSIDLLASVLLSLSRFEETLPGNTDDHDRFPASRSVAVREAFLHRPIVDEYGLAFQEVLTRLLPRWRPAERKLRVKLSHDIDMTGLPPSLKSAVGHTVRRRRPLATVRDVMSWVTATETTYLRLVQEIVRLSADHGLDSAVYWMASPPGPLDSGYDPRTPRVRRVIDALRRDGVEMGVHPGYNTFRSPELLSQEVQNVRNLLGEIAIGGRQHFLRWCPDTWLHWEACGLAYDSTVGHAEQIGFRGGTCLPYRPWLLAQNREADLVEIPLIAMDCTLLNYMHLTPEQSLDALTGIAARCRLVGGVFTLLWHNHSLIEPGYGYVYRNILDKLAGAESYDWKASSNRW